MEVLRRLLNTPGIDAILKKHSLDVEALSRELASPPDAVVKLRAQLVGARGHLADAVGHQDYERAARAQKQIAALGRKVQAAEYAWLKTLGR